MADLTLMQDERNQARDAALPHSWLSRLGLLLVALMTLGIVLAAFVRC